MKVHVYCVFDYFLFNLVSNSVGELRESACLLCVWLFSLQSCLQLQLVSYVKVHVSILSAGVWCLFSLFNLVSNSVGELRKSACYCVFDYFLFNLVSTSVKLGWVTWKCMFIVCLTIFSSILSPLSYMKVEFNSFLFKSPLWVTRKCLVFKTHNKHALSSCLTGWVGWQDLLCVWLFSLQ